MQLSAETTGPLNASCVGGLVVCRYAGEDDHHPCDVCWGEDNGVKYHEVPSWGIKGPGWAWARYGCSFSWVPAPCKQSARAMMAIQLSPQWVVRGSAIVASYLRGRAYHWTPKGRDGRSDRGSYQPYTLQPGDGAKRSLPQKSHRSR